MRAVTFFRNVAEGVGFHSMTTIKIEYSLKFVALYGSLFKYSFIKRRD